MSTLPENGDEGQERSSGLRMVLVMGGVGLLASILLVTTFRLTAPRIAANRAAYLAASLDRVLDGVERFDALVPTDTAWRPGSDADEGGRVFAGYVGDSLVGLAVEAAGQGYQDIIRILYGYSPACECLVGMTILESKETPGLGDKIEKDPAFQANFESLMVAVDGVPADVVLVKRGTKTEPWQIDAITGATVSSQAITDIIASSTRRLVEALGRLGLPVASEPAAAEPGGAETP
jgi:H+/Na+-translocating ferredoxin:NAD+ oxidoreductase subunit G